MTTIQTTGHIVNGVLRVEVPIEGQDQDVPVVLVVNDYQPKDAPAVAAPAVAEDEDPYREWREKMARDPEAFKGYRLPPPGRRKRIRIEPIKIDDGQTASDLLIRDRR